MNRFSSSSFVLVSLLGACADTGSPTADTSGPSVVAVSPADGATSVSPDTALVVTFDERIDPSTVDPKWVHLGIGNYDVPIALGVENGDELHVSLLAGMGNHASYELSVTSVGDMDGNRMAPFSSRFSTATASLQASDPNADTIGSGTVQPDVIAATASAPDTSLLVTLTFAQPISPYIDNLPSSLGGYIDLDTDQNPKTGQSPIADYFRTSEGSAELGDEFIVSLFQNPDGTMDVMSGDGLPVGSVTPTFASTSVSLTIPLAMLGNDDGNVNLAALVGSISEPTDIVPNDSHLTLGKPAQASCTTSTAARTAPASATSAPLAPTWANRW